MRAIRSFFKAILLFAIALVGALFALHNKQAMSVDFIYFRGPEISLGLWLMLFLMFGALLGVVVSSLMVGSYRRKLGHFKKRDE
ncbi:MAG: LapA family protein [Porticoccaceae bacterium]|nr:LapA family protein [Porticoccaceae bacterium]